ncbi:MAG: hypothetical protein HZC40_17370 [Chloroflexi bacterium]|nr:hypothetical protein [Chloroflexota bacterium]
MKTQSRVSDVTIQISSEPILTVPKSIGKELGVRTGQHVSVDVRVGMIYVRKNRKRRSTIQARPNGKPRARRVSTFANLAGAIPAKPGAPQINIEEMMSHHGYEQLERPGRQGF